MDRTPSLTIFGTRRATLSASTLGRTTDIPKSMIMILLFAASHIMFLV